VLKTTLIVLNIVVGVGLLGVVVGASVAKSRRRVAPANLTRHYEDAVLENQHLSRVLGWALLLTALSAVALPVYWLLIPTIQERHTDAFLERSIEQGRLQFEPATEENLVGLGCSTCHGGDGSGGAAPRIYNDPITERTYSLSWEAPALNTVFYRFPREQIKNIIVYGRPNTPMPAWGLAGGGAVNDQGVEDILNYIESIQVGPEEMRKQITDALARESERNPEATNGELLFNVACARCHTEGWSLRTSYEQPPTEGGGGGAGQPLPLIPGGGAYGPSLTNARVERQFPDPADQAEFIGAGSRFQIAYGERGIGSGGMPGYARQCDEGQVLVARDCTILTPEEIEAIVEYERGLEEPETGADEGGGGGTGTDATGTDATGTGATGAGETAAGETADDTEGANS
jgi:mono/diheme cytochrome c family protein